MIGFVKALDRRVRLEVVVVVGYVLVGCATFAYNYSARLNHVDDPSIFGRWTRSDSSDRRPIAEELVAEKLLIGMSRAEVVRRLGRPSVVHYKGRMLSWYVGYVKSVEGDFLGLFDDDVYLEVEFTGDTVKDARVYISPH
jgi:hypothetical protein